MMNLSVKKTSPEKQLSASVCMKYIKMQKCLNIYPPLTKEHKLYAECGDASEASCSPTAASCSSYHCTNISIVRQLWGTDNLQTT